MTILPLKCPSAIAPLVMSLLAIALVAGHAAIYGVVHEIDEGAAAHIFQLLMAGQVPVVAYFAIKWLPRLPAQALRVLSVQAALAAVAVALVGLLT